MAFISSAAGSRQHHRHLTIPGAMLFNSQELSRKLDLQIAQIPPDRRVMMIISTSPITQLVAVAQSTRRNNKTRFTLIN